MSASTPPQTPAGESPQPPGWGDVTVTGGAAAMPRPPTEPWWLRVSLGAVAVAVGLVVLAWPDATIRVLAVLFGLNLFFEGIMRVLQAVLAPAEGVAARVLYGLLGLFSIVLGVLCMRHIAGTVAVLVLFVGLFWLVAGIVELIVALSGGPPSQWTARTALELVTGVVAVLAGAFVLAFPGVTLRTFVALLAATLLIYGAVSVVSGLRLRARGPA
jgi:uncharacterized membrane protein HdeD (DUF308 family)